MDTVDGVGIQSMLDSKKSPWSVPYDYYTAADGSIANGATLPAWQTEAM